MSLPCLRAPERPSYPCLSVTSPWNLPWFPSDLHSRCLSSAQLEAFPLWVTVI
jgi:hypothetical protein